MKRGFGIYQKQISQCRLHCGGVCNSPENGILPRGLHYDESNSKCTDGIIVCGLNPGRSDIQEREYYLEHGNTIKAIRDYYKSYVTYKSRYFKEIRMFLNSIGHSGPTLWTNIAKCEAAKDQRRISFITHPQTFRTCANHFLVHEINLVDKSWVILAIGRDAFTALSYIFYSRRVLGIPHPTGAGPNFRRLFKSENKLYKDISTKLDIYFKETNNAMWLSG